MPQLIDDATMIVAATKKSEPRRARRSELAQPITVIQQIEMARVCGNSGLVSEWSGRTIAQSSHSSQRASR